MPTNLSFLEFYNTSGDADPSIRVLGCLRNRHRAGYARIAALTLTDDGAHKPSRARFLAGMVAGHAAAGVTDLVRLDQDGIAGVSGVGVVGTAFAGSPDFAVDLIHQNTAGYLKIAAHLQPVIATY